jgi:hypothetical protein
METTKVTKSIHIRIVCNEDDDSGFEISLEEVFAKLKEGYVWGKGGNEDEEYFFEVKTTEN